MQINHHTILGSLLLAAATLIVQTGAFAQVHEYDYDASHSEVGFDIVHLAVSKVHGRFNEVDVAVKLDPADLSTLEASAVMQVASINTNHEKRDSDLQGDDFFASATYPEIKFVSTGVSEIEDDGSFMLHGDLTIRDVTKRVVLEAEMRGPYEHRGTERLGFSAETEIDRFDYGLQWGALTEFGGLVASREVDLVIELELRRNLE